MARSPENPQSFPENTPRTDITIMSERAVLKEEEQFLTQQGTFEKEKSRNIGVLTTRDLGLIASLYPVIREGMLIVYDYLEKPSGESSPEEWDILSEALITKLGRGDLVSDDEAEKLLEKLRSGGYSMQLRARKHKDWDDIERIRESDESKSGLPKLGKLMASRRVRLKLESVYKEIIEESDLVFNKRIIQSKVLELTERIQALYGEVNFRQALATELLLNAPFVESLTSCRDQSEDTKRRHQGYIDDLRLFLQRFNPEQRFANFEQLTDKYQTNWAHEVSISQVSPFDQEYARSVYRLAGKIISGNYSLDEVYELLRKTVLRRGSLFMAKIDKIEDGDSHVQIDPVQIEEASFSDIGGYEEQKQWYKLLVDKLRRCDPIVNDIGIIIAAGPAGVGKSLGVNTFLNSLPENTKGIILDRSMVTTIRGRLPQYETLIELAKLHPELQLFAILEDMDLFASDRTSNPFTAGFIQIDSVVPEALPDNLHIIGTTNKLEAIDSAVKRPGRTSKILIYDAPKKAEERVEIARIHAKNSSVAISDDLLAYLGQETANFTPAEIKHIIWSLVFEEIEHPTQEDVKRFIDEVRRKHKLLKDDIGFKTAQSR